MLWSATSPTVPAPCPRIRRRTAMGCLLAALTAPLTGCAFHPTGPHGPACSAIEAATVVELSSERLLMLRRIANRPQLSQHEQTYLVNAIIHGGLGGDQADPLIVLIENPVCTEQTRKQITTELRWVAYSGERKRIADALSRPPVPRGQERLSDPIHPDTP
jgi:hypothetical protein